jgi:hypothetical protein
MSDNKTEATFHGPPPPVIAGPPGEPDPATIVVTPLDKDWPVNSALKEPTTMLPVWVDAAQRHGTVRATDVAPDFGRAGMHSWEPEPGERPAWPPRAGAWIALGVAVVAVLISSGFVVQRMNWLPASVPLIGKDSGVAACQAIAEGQPPVHSKGIISEADYRSMREVFADSRYTDIRVNGTKLMDLAWQAQGMGQNNLGILALMGGIADAYSGLAGGCQAAGYTIPSLGS